MLNKINNLRVTFRKEPKKVESANKSGAGSNDIYETIVMVGYFKHLGLRDPRDGDVKCDGS